MWADQGYTGAFAEWLHATRGWHLEVVRHHPARQAWRYGYEDRPGSRGAALPQRGARGGALPARTASSATTSREMLAPPVTIANRFPSGETS